MLEWMIGLGGSMLIAGIAYWRGSLTWTGAAAAVAVGTSLYAAGSPVWFILMIGFFVTSTGLTKWKQHRKREAEAVYQKSGRRDAGQVIANGGIGTVLCLIQAASPQAIWPLAAYLGVMATVTADTWATEVGGLSRSLPRSILTWRTVPKGTSGGVSGLGWGAAACGGLFIGTLAVSLATWDETVDSITSGSPMWLLPIIVMAGGWLGANADSYLGATLQAVYRCPHCSREVESKVHCQSATLRIRGFERMDNDAVNIISSLAGGTVSAILVGLLL
ncbi:DUF92 domain-containing protein [Gorillibacterium sp. sgz5001074]|uniref:DUF92 domain-containing protein n=1 Tax=Gorillibacterium sp. sgz5001074 TaxID=3446695 RepID=UPI003F66593D